MLPDANNVTIKVKCGGNITLLFPLSPSSGVVELRQQVARRLPLELEDETYSMKYKDEDDHEILIAVDEDLQDYIRECRRKGKTVVVILLVPREINDSSVKRKRKATEIPESLAHGHIASREVKNESNTLIQTQCKGGMFSMSGSHRLAVKKNVLKEPQGSKSTSSKEKLQGSGSSVLNIDPKLNSTNLNEKVWAQSNKECSMYEQFLGNKLEDELMLLKNTVHGNAGHMGVNKFVEHHNNNEDSAKLDTIVSLLSDVKRCLKDFSKVLETSFRSLLQEIMQQNKDLLMKTPTQNSRTHAPRSTGNLNDAIATQQPARLPTDSTKLAARTLFPENNGTWISVDDEIDLADDMDCVDVHSNKSVIERLNPTAREDDIKNFLFDQSKDQSELVIDFGEWHLSRANLHCLFPQEPLNGSIIDCVAYLLTIEMLDENGFRPRWYFPTLFSRFLLIDDYEDDKIIRGFLTGPQRFSENIQYCEQMFIPMNDDHEHWYLCVVDFELKIVSIMDTLSTPQMNTFRKDRVMQMVERLDHLLKRWEPNKYKLKNMRDEFKFELEEWVPQQTNSYDCGMCVCLLMMYHTDFKKTMTEEESIIARNRLAVRLYTCKKNKFAWKI